MATEEQKNVLQQNASGVPSDSELFTGEVHKELSEREVFVGDEDFYSLLADSTPAAAAQQPAGATQTPLRPIQHKRFSSLQKVLITAIIVIGAILLYVLLEPLLRPLNKIPTPTAQQAHPSELPVEDSTQAEGSTQVVQEQIQEPEPLFPPAQPLSLEVARNFYLQKDYGKAHAAYNQLHQSLPAGAKEELLRDFLQFKMALCLRKAGNSDQASRLFRTLSQSRSLVVRVVANYNLSLLQVQNKQYLKARAKAYQTIALLKAVDFDKDWALSLQRDCHFLIAGSMTCLLYTSPSPRDRTRSRMPSSA